MDISEPYVQYTRAHLADADGKIVFDKFHVVKHLHEAVDRVRRGEHRALKREGDARLTGSKYLWLRRAVELSLEHRAVLRALQREDFKVGRAWALKERFRTFWEYRYPGAARTFFTRWYWRATHNRLKPMTAAAKLIQRHLPNLLTYLRASRDQRRAGGRQRRHPVGEEDGARLPQRRAFQDGHLLPLWRSRPLPTRNPVEPSIGKRLFCSRRASQRLKE